MNGISQRVFDIAIASPAKAHGIARRIALSGTALLLRVWSGVFGDPIVSATICGVRLSLPMSHALPRILIKYPEYSTNIGRISLVASQKYPQLKIVDIGANIGDTVAMVRRFVSVPTLCVDGDARFFSLLYENTQQWEDVELECAFVGRDCGLISGRLLSKSGSGHLVEDGKSQTEVLSLATILMRHPPFLHAKLIKIDTDGFDTQIIKGSIDTIAEVKPLVFFEYDPFLFRKHDPEGFQVFDLLRTHGYAAALFYENTGELTARVDLRDEARLRSMHDRCGDRAVDRYFDVLVAHIDDLDVIASIHALAEQSTLS